MFYDIINEATIGNIGEEFRLDLLDRRTKHGNRLKIVKRSGGHNRDGSSVPVNNKWKTYDEIKYSGVVEYESISKHLIPLIIGFAVIYHNELIELYNAFLYGNIKVQNDIRPYIENAWIEYYFEFKDANEGTIRSHANKVYSSRNS